MLRNLLAVSAIVAALFGAPSAVQAQSGCPSIATGAVLTAAQWNACFAAKQNNLGYAPVNRAGDTMLGKLTTAASQTSGAGFNIPQGSAPASPQNGDIWTTLTGVYARINGATVGPFGAISGSSFAATSPLSVTFPAGVVTYALGYDSSLTLSGSNLSVATAPAGALTGTVLNATVVSSSLTSVGALSSGSLATGFTPITNALLANSATTVNGQNCALGGSCTVTASATEITVGTTTITGGTTGRPLYDNAGVLGELTVTGSGSAVLATSPTIASPTFTGTVAGSNTIPLTILAQSAANTMLGNWTGSTANVTANAMPSCADTGGAHLNYVSGTGITCGSSTGAAAAGSLTGTTLAANVVSSSLTSVGALAGGSATTGFTISASNVTWSGAVPGANVAVVADASGSTSATFGVMKCDGVTTTCSSGVVTAIGGTATAITVGTTSVGSGTSTRVLYNNAGVLGEYTISGTGSVAMTNSPAFTTPDLGTPSAVNLSNGTALPISGINGLGTGVGTALAVNIGSAGAPVLFNGAGGTPSSIALANGTGLPISTGVSGLGTGIASALAVNTGSAGAPGILIAKGTSAMGTGAISSATCATVVTTSATGVATTDTINASFNGDPTAVTGYVPLTTGMLTIIAYPTANNVNFKVCNNTAGSITPGAITLNWIVVR